MDQETYLSQRKLQKLLNLDLNVKYVKDNNDVDTWMQKFIDSVKQTSDVSSLDPFLTKEYQKNKTKQLYLNSMQRLLKDAKNVSYKTVYQEGCRARIQVTIEKPNIKDVYEILLVSCDDQEWQIDLIGLGGSAQNLNIVLELQCQLISTTKDLIGKPIGTLTMSMGTSSLDKKIVGLKIKGQLKNLQSYANQKLGLHIHEFGVLSPSCMECGPHFNPDTKFHGGTSGERHVGDLGNIQVDSTGLSNVDILIPIYPLTSFAGRSIVLHDKEDDLGLGKNNDSGRTGNSGKRIACGILGVSR